ncbi:MAG: hypothetical protein WC756_03730 [Taibaiella sp.]|jgi:hypothetical protein
MDVFVTELAGYGDLQKKGDDLVMALSYESLPFLALFGGTEDWWGNALLPNQDEKFNSITEQTMREVALNSAGRIKIEAAIKSDLEFLKRNVPGVQITVNTFIVSPDRLDIKIIIDQEEWNFKWNPNATIGIYLLPEGGIFTEQFTDEFA